MAPGILDSQQRNEQDPAKNPLIGPKEGFDGGPKSFNTNAEVKGTKTQPPASHPNYLPTWDPDEK